MSSTAEAAIVGTLLAEWPAELPPFCSRMLEHAPESFFDLRCGEVAVAIRATRDLGEPVAPLTVRRRLNGHADAGFFDVELPANALPIALAEYEAQSAWKDYRQRRLKTIYHEAATAMGADPSKADSIADNVRRSIDDVADPIGAESLTALRFNPDIEPPPIRPIYRLANTVVATPGNLVTITAAIKSGKSAVVGAMAAAAMQLSSNDSSGDLLGFDSSNPKSLALVKFDTEQSPDDFWHCDSRALRRAGLSKPPAWFYSYRLTGLAQTEAWHLVTVAVREAADQCGGVHSILLDGVADLVADVNDPAESNAFVATLHGMAIEFDCPIVGVIHFNPGTEKSRGHLGSQLERKAESNLALEKDSEETTVIYSTKNRRAGIPKATGPRFRFDTAAGMHVLTASRESVKDQQKKERLTRFAEDLFNGRSALRYKEILSALPQLAKCGLTTAETRISDMVRLGVISKSVAGLYVLSPQNPNLPQNDPN